MRRSAADRVTAALADRPHLREALAAGVLNHAATARHLGVEGADERAVASALRRLAAGIDPAGTGLEPRVRVDRSPADGWAGGTRDPPADAVAVRAEGVDLAHHREVLGRLGASGVVLFAATFDADRAAYLVAEGDLHRTIAALERPTSPAVRAAIDSSADRDKGR